MAVAYGFVSSAESQVQGPFIWRLIINVACFSLNQKGALKIFYELVFAVGAISIANSSLMKQLEADKDYTVVQFEQAGNRYDLFCQYQEKKI